MRPPTTAPLFFIAFAATHILFYLGEIGFSLMKTEESSRSMVYNVVGMLVPGIFVCIAGTFPLQAMKVAPNVAGPTDVSTPMTHIPKKLTSILHRYRL